MDSAEYPSDDTSYLRTETFIAPACGHWHHKMSPEPFSGNCTIQKSTELPKVMTLKEEQPPYNDGSMKGNKGLASLF